ncbi:MAG: VIT family protein [Actinomycetes bacterium]
MPARTGSHRESHRHDRVGWLRAAVLGANDGIVSTTSLMIGVAAANADRPAILIAGLAGLVAGSASMALGEYVSVSSQKDTEEADIARESLELEATPDHELEELMGIYISRGLSPELAARVAEELTAHDPLGAHLRDELGILEHTRARPRQAAVVSALAFAIGSVVPVLVMALLGTGATGATRIGVSAVVALIMLGVLGTIGARLGGAPPRRAAIRVVVGGAIAMAASAGIGQLLGATVA